MNSYFEISANTVTCYANICNCYYKQSRVLLIPLWFVVSIITEENDEFQLQVGENKGVICFSSEFTDPLNPIQGHFGTPGMESLCTRILIRERERKAETQALRSTVQNVLCSSFILFKEKVIGRDWAVYIFLIIVIRRNSLKIPYFLNYVVNKQNNKKTEIPSTFSRKTKGYKSFTC